MNNDKTQMEKDIKRQEAVRTAVTAADKIILEASDGSFEETNYLTSMVARIFMEKALNPFLADIMYYDLFGHSMRAHWKNLREKQRSSK